MTDQTKSENSLVEDWLKKAGDDELNIQSLLKHRDAGPSGICFFAQQIAEKYLKAFLLYTGSVSNAHSGIYLD